MISLPAGKFVLRTLNEDDTTSVLAAVKESSSTVGKWMTWATPSYSMTEAVAWIAACKAGLADRSCYEFGIFDASTGAFIGAAGLNQFNKVNSFCNLGYWVRESAQGRGAATAAAIALRDYAFTELGLCRIEIVAAVGNEPSATVARKAGALLECTARSRLQLHGAPRDAYVYSFVPAAEA